LVARREQIVPPVTDLAVPADIRAYRARVQRRTLTVVLVSQILGGAGLAAGVTVGALLAQQMLGSDRLAGVPTAFCSPSDRRWLRTWWGASRSVGGGGSGWGSGSAPAGWVRPGWSSPR